MQFHVAFIPAIVLTGFVYLLVAAGLLKNNIKQLYSRRTKREKFLTIGVVIAAVVMMLFVVGRLAAPAEMGLYSSTLHGALLWLLGGSEDMLIMAAYLVCALPVMIVSAGILDEIAQKYTILEVPYFFYVLLFAVEEMFYKPSDISVTGWFILLLYSTAFYCKMKMTREGRNKTKDKLNAFMVAVMIGICVLEVAVPAELLVRYTLLMCFNAGMSVVLNRTSVLKKKVWLIVIMLCYMAAFIVGRIL